ncbi:transposable element Tcb2 transposase [Trichonephila clavipes]|uniref:Transposable element Tcb2 transposase n=1 Tax=Trichonephila clavipes TaxID=2585209 RepID=A0A8X6VVH9_TRICX|nr:transposable element Tcb2 transposase [Trichonephila clavipes]
MVREDTDTPNEGTTNAWMAADEAVGCTRAFLTMWWASRRLVCRGHPEPGLHKAQVNVLRRGIRAFVLLTVNTTVLCLPLTCRPDYACRDSVQMKNRNVHPRCEEWRDCDAGCQHNCSNVGQDLICPRIWISGCVCDDPGTVRGPDGKCIPPPLCPASPREAWRIVGRLEGGQTQAEVAQAIGVSQSVISKIWNPFLETGSVDLRPALGCRRTTTPNEDLYLVLTARRHRNMNATLLQQHLRSATGTTVSTQSVQNQLHGACLYAYRPMRDRGNRNNPAFVHESVRFDGGAVLVYGGISIEGRTCLYIIRDGPLTAPRYSDEILRPIVVHYAAAIGDDFILMDNNCRLLRANLLEHFLFEEGITRMEWPACSPDMNPIEHVWDALGRQVAGCQPPPQTLQEQERTLLDERDRIPQLVINILIDSML